MLPGARTTDPAGKIRSDGDVLAAAVVLVLAVVFSTWGGAEQPNTGRFVDAVRSHDYAAGYTDGQVSALFERICSLSDSGADPMAGMGAYRERSTAEAHMMVVLALPMCE